MLVPVTLNWLPIVLSETPRRAAFLIKRMSFSESLEAPLLSPLASL